MIEVIKFWAPWCSPCVSYAPSFTAVREELESQNIIFQEINIDEHSSKTLTNKFEIKSIPTTVVIRDNKVKHISGKINEDTLKNFILNE